MHELTASQLVAIVTRSDTGSHNRLDPIQSLVPPHYLCNGYIYTQIHVLVAYLLNIRKSGVHTCLPVAVNEAIPPYKTGSQTK